MNNCNLPPTLTDCPIPTPPVTINAPVVVLVEPVDAVNPTEPVTCNLYAGFDNPTPIFPANSAITTLPSALARSNGMPDMSPTLKIQPVDRLLFMPNNFPEVPSNIRELSDNTDNVIGVPVVPPINAMEGLDAPVYPSAA